MNGGSDFLEELSLSAVALRGVWVLVVRNAWKAFSEVAQF